MSNKGRYFTREIDLDSMVRNPMLSNLNANGKTIFNLGAPITQDSAVRLRDVSGSTATNTWYLYTAFADISLNCNGIQDVSSIFFCGRQSYLRQTPTIFDISSNRSIRFNNNQLFLQNNGNVGIGTSSPLYKLDVSGSFKSRTINDKDNTSGEIGYLLASTEDGYLWTNPASISVGTSTISLDNKWTTIGNNIYNNNTGNVGIGTSTPSYKLDVNGRTIIRNSLYMNSTDISDVSGIYFSDGAYIGHGNSFDIRSNEVIKFNNNRLVINTNGNIGIGTTTPQYTLDVSGSVNIGNSLFQVNTTNNSIVLGSNTVKYGTFAGSTYQGTSGIAIGYQAAQGFSGVASGQGDYAIAIGYQAGQGIAGSLPSGQGINAIALGTEAGNRFQGPNTVAIGTSAGLANQGQYAVAIGYLAGYSGQASNSIVLNSTGVPLVGDTSGTYIAPIRNISNNKALYYNTLTKEVTYGDISNGGLNQWTTSGNNIYNNNTGNVGIGIISPIYKLDVSGETRISTTNVRIGINAGSTNQDIWSVAIGNNAGSNNQGSNSISIGTGAGISNEGFNSIAIGLYAGAYDQSKNSIAIGSYAGYTGQMDGCHAIGYFAGYTNQKIAAVALGNFAGGNNQGTSTIAIGAYAGQDTQGSGAIAIGFGAGYLTQGTSSIAIGNYAGNYTQGSTAIAIGFNAGVQTQGNSAIAIGFNAGRNTQGSGAISIGWVAGQFSQGNNAIAIGVSAGRSNQDISAIAIGFQSGLSGERMGSIAIGHQAGCISLGTNAIAIGSLAGRTNQAANSILINATGNDLSNVAVSGLFIDPIRETSTTKVLNYNTTTKEVTYGNLTVLDISNSSGLSGEILVSIGNNSGYKWMTPVYGSFTSDLSQNVTADPSNIPLTYNRAEIAHLCDYTGSKIYVRRSGIFKFLYSIQYTHTLNQDVNVDTYIRINGVNVPRSNSRILLKKDGFIFPVCEYIVPMNKNDYIEVIAYTTAGTVYAFATETGLNPAIPSIISDIYSLVVYP